MGSVGEVTTIDDLIKFDRYKTSNRVI